MSRLFGCCDLFHNEYLRRSFGVAFFYSCYSYNRDYSGGASLAARSPQFSFRFLLCQLQGPVEAFAVSIAVGTLADTLFAQSRVVGYLVAGHLFGQEVDQQVSCIGT